MPTKSVQNFQECGQYYMYCRVLEMHSFLTLSQSRRQYTMYRGEILLLKKTIKNIILKDLKKDVLKINFIKSNFLSFIHE